MEAWWGTEARVEVWVAGTRDRHGGAHILNQIIVFCS